MNEQRHRVKQLPVQLESRVQDGGVGIVCKQSTGPREIFKQGNN